MKDGAQGRGIYFGGHALRVARSPAGSYGLGAQAASGLQPVSPSAFLKHRESIGRDPDPWGRVRPRGSGGIGIGRRAGCVIQPLDTLQRSQHRRPLRLPEAVRVVEHQHAREGRFATDGCIGVHPSRVEGSLAAGSDGRVVLVIDVEPRRGTLGPPQRALAQGLDPHLAQLGVLLVVGPRHPEALSLDPLGPPARSHQD